MSKKKDAKERRLAYESLPPNIKNAMSEEEKEMFLNADEWPEELFEKLEEFIIK